MRRARGDRGLSLVEVVVATAISAGLMLLAVQLAGSADRSAAGSSKRAALLARASSAADALVQDLQVSGMSGEDENSNGVLDSDEDGNNNGRLDSDWSLADGQAASTLTFNRIERRWVWTGPITYAVVDGVLRRTEGDAIREMCRNVTAFSVSRASTRVTISLTCGGRDARGAEWSETATRRVYVRN